MGQMGQTGIQGLVKVCIVITELRGIILDKLNWVNAEAYQPQPQDITSIWHMLCPLVRKWCKLEGNGYNAENIFLRLTSGIMQVLCVHNAGDIRLIVLSEFDVSKEKKILRIVGIAGENPLVGKKFLPMFEVWGKANGAVELESKANSDTLGLIKRLGLSVKYTVLSKEL